MNKTPLATIETKPGTVGFIDGDFRIAKVGFVNDKSEQGYHSAIRWYLPKTREDRFLVYHYKESLRGSK